MHFTVLVIGTPIDEILAPYEEGIEVKPYISATSYERELQFKKYQITAFKYYQNGNIPSEFEKLTMSLNHVTPEWSKEWSDEDIDENGNAISTRNPNGNWDWYSVGGRWTGIFKLKPGAQGKLGVPGAFNNPPRFDADITRIKDVDWVAMHKLAKENAAKAWDDLFKPYNKESCHYNPDYLASQKKLHIEMYGTKKEYIRRRGYWTTYALVSKKEGWVAPGEMGWFSSTDETKDRDEFDSKFVKTLKSYPKNTIITLVDCHT
jgi:hypothetical protein